jgi:genome maintenance exonuclease 1
MKTFRHRNDIDFEIAIQESVKGKRVYVTPKDEVYPSITSVLSRVPKPGLKDWRKRVGETEAKKIMRESSTLGTAVHKICECYLHNDSYPKNNKKAIDVFNRLRFILNGNIDNIVGLEVPMYSDILRVAGTTDCIADYNGKLSIIDFKTSKRTKKEEWVEDYYIQTFAYGLMFEELTGIAIEQVVILIACTEEFDVQVFKKPYSEMVHYIEELVSIMKRYPYVTSTHQPL